MLNLSLFGDHVVKLALISLLVCTIYLGVQFLRLNYDRAMTRIRTQHRESLTQLRRSQIRRSA